MRERVREARKAREERAHAYPAARATALERFVEIRVVAAGRPVVRRSGRGLLDVEHLHDHHDRGEQRHGDHQAEEAEHQREQRLRDDGERRREVHAALHEQRDEDVVLEELDAPVDDGNDERLLGRVEEAHRDAGHGAEDAAPRSG